MISIFHKEATGVDFHNYFLKAPICFTGKTLTKLQENIIIANIDFPKAVFKKKTVTLDSYISSG